MNIGLKYKLDTKKALKDTVKSGAQPQVLNFSLFHSGVPDGEHVVVGPDIERNRKWFAGVIVKDSRVVKVTS